MDKSDLQTMLQFAAQFNMMHRDVAKVKEEYDKFYSTKPSICITLW